MPNEMSKSLERRKYDESFALDYFVGHGLDVGCGPDPLKPSADFPHILSVQGFDRDRYPGVIGGDAEKLDSIVDNAYDFVVSAHCLEHMKDPFGALANWLRVLRPGGHLVVTIPDWELYEHRQWPSHFNGDHKFAWTLNEGLKDDGPHVIHLPTFLAPYEDGARICYTTRINDHFDMELGGHIDQTGGPAECALEFVLQKL